LFVPGMVLRVGDLDVGYRGDGEFVTDLDWHGECVS